MSDAPPPVPTGLGELNALPATRATGLLREVCAAGAWVAAVRDGRPYPTPAGLCAASDAAVARLTRADLAEAMAGHPPIGRPTPGDPEAAREQRGMADAPAALRTRMRELNLAYREKFGHVFLICATGLTAADMLAALTARMAHTPQQEWETVRTELSRINRVRLARLMDTGTGTGTPPAGPAPRTGQETT